MLINNYELQSLCKFISRQFRSNSHQYFRLHIASFLQEKKLHAHTNYYFSQLAQIINKIFYHNRSRRRNNCIKEKKKKQQYYAELILYIRFFFYFISLRAAKLTLCI